MHITRLTCAGTSCRVIRARFHARKEKRTFAMPTPYILSYKMQLHASGRCTCYLPQIDDPSLEKIEILSAAYLLRENDERLLRKTKLLKHKGTLKEKKAFQAISKKVKSL